ncbi:PAS domain-containing protein [Blastochloris viridis]|uniref:PAS domain-containing protein n=1 Tax=Blastochloris viridis TaxID=1079 RepID=A0A0H5BES3_BLAVI|nr:PAS domain-containing protein [Blastochloris viridis]ALK09395.1 PAS domain protein [Blastochloris viridis]BAS00726.1 hypothetical protein BV133_3132 [Blastochloris viridis]CUU42058.1 hypothetical protein BVIRIDIS_10600 [Blastochloris viridis]
MKHPMLRHLFMEWNRQRGDRAAPERALISPANIAGALPDVLTLALDATSGHLIRLAGSRTCAMFGRELRGSAFVELFAAPDRDAIALLIAEIAESQAPALAQLMGMSVDHGELALELLLLPLLVDGATHAQMLCGLAGPETPWWLMGDPVRELHIRSVHHLHNGVEHDVSRRCANLGKGVA